MGIVGDEILRAQELDSNLAAQRLVEIRLAANWPRPLRLPWNQGVVGQSIGARTRRTLNPGDSTIIDIGRACAYFGVFTVPHDLEQIYDEKKREARIAMYEAEKARAILTWGEYPRAINHQRDGNEPLGPARMPDVYLTVIETDGSRWPEIRLRELYDLGDYYDAEPKPKAFVAPTDTKQEDRVRDLEIQLAEMRGLVHGQLAQNAAAIAVTHDAKARGKE